MPFHVVITPKSNRTHDEVRLDLTFAELEERFLKPYKEGRSLVIGGRTIPVDDIERIKVFVTSAYSNALLPQIRRERMQSRVVTPTSDEWYVAHKGEDVTDKYITEPPGTNPAIPMNTITSNPRTVFVVHGRNLLLRDSMFSFLRAIGLHPLEWNEVILSTGKASPFVGEVLDKAFRTAQAIIVLFTPDDEAKLRKAHWNANEPSHETNLTGQARPNVLFEAGMAMGRDADRTVLVEIGQLRPFSDLGGRHLIRLNNTTQRRQEFAQRLQSAGCAVNLNGTDWHTTGDFEIVIPESNI
jgi:predicted nucleotide-binding protein